MASKTPTFWDLPTFGPQMNTPLNDNFRRLRFNDALKADMSALQTTTYQTVDDAEHNFGGLWVKVMEVGFKTKVKNQAILCVFTSSVQANEPLPTSHEFKLQVDGVDIEGGKGTYTDLGLQTRVPINIMGIPVVASKGQHTLRVLVNKNAGEAINCARSALRAVVMTMSGNGQAPAAVAKQTPVDSPGLPTVAGQSGSVDVKNLVIGNNATYPNTRIDISADVLAIENIVAAPLSVTATTSGTGLNARDAGSVAANTWYYVFGIASSDGLTGSLLSTSATAPAMPTGYTKKRRIGAVRTNASSNLLQFVQEGNAVNYLASYGILSGGTATTPTTIAASAYIPPTSRRGRFSLNIAVRHTVVGTYLNMTAYRTGTTTSPVQVTTQAIVASVDHNVTNHVVCETNSSQQIDYKLANTPSSGGGYINVLGYFDRI